MKQWYEKDYKPKHSPSHIYNHLEDLGNMNNAKRTSEEWRIYNDLKFYLLHYNYNKDAQELSLSQWDKVCELFDELYNQCCEWVDANYDKRFAEGYKTGMIAAKERISMALSQFESKW